MSARGAAPLDPPEAEIARPEVVTESQFTGMVLRSRSRESRSKATVRENVHSERSGCATRPEPEVARPETEIAPVARQSYGEISVVDSRSPSVESDSEAGVETQWKYPFPARQEPEITPIPFHPITNPLRSFTGPLCNPRFFTRMALGRAHTCTEAAAHVAKLLLLNQPCVTFSHAEYFSRYVSAPT